MYSILQGVTMNKNASYVSCFELGIDERCNLTCLYCSQNIPNYNKRYSDTSFETIKKVCSLIQDREFYMLKVSGGGEPTLHKDFRAIIMYLKENVKADNYVLATNGYKVLDYVQELSRFKVDIAHYPGQNDEIIAKIKAASLPPNFEITVKRNDTELVNIHDKRPNKNKENIDKFACELFITKKFLRDRISPCCLTSGICSMLGLSYEDYSLELEEGVLDRINNIDITNLCRECPSEIKG